MSLSERWLIDGWNVLHGLSALRDSRQSVLSADDILSMLSEFASQSGCRVLLVWDGHGPGGKCSPKKNTPSSVEVMYSFDQTADAVLERYLYAHRTEARFVVVTDDGAIGRIAHGLGARVFSVVRFKETLEELRQSRKDKAHETRVDEHGFNRPFNKFLSQWKRPAE